MRFIPIIPALTMLIVVGCDSTSVISNSAEVDATPIEDTDTGAGDADGILAQFSGATFVAVAADQVNADSTSGVGSVSFTNDAVSWTQSEIVMTGSFVLSQSVVVEAGSYENDGSGELVASFPDRDVTFAADGGNLIWDSLSYRRAVGSQYNSQNSLEAYLDGSTFNTIDQFTAAGDQTDGQAMASRSVRFDGNQAFWAEPARAVLAGTLSFVDESSFTMKFLNREVAVVALDRNEIVIDAVIYEKDLSNQFDSQESLIEFLDNGSFRSTSLQNVGETTLGAAIGYWFIDFTDDMFTWSYQGISEAGAVSFIGSNRFSAVFSNRELAIEVEGDDLLWNGVRYSKVIGG